MDFLTVILLFAIAGFLLKRGEQRQHIALLASHLGHFQIEKLMERLNDGYMRALSEADPERQTAVWAAHESAEQTLAQQFQRFAEAFEKVDAVHTRINRGPLPHAHRWLPGWLAPGFDARALMKVHARGIARTVANEDRLPARDRARTLLAELYLMQHSCHWFCRSPALASARLMVRHHTRYDQVLQTVSPWTAKAYAEVTGVEAPKGR